MDNPVTWIGLLVAVLSGVRGEWRAYQARCVERDKAEESRLAVRDKMEFDATCAALTAENSALTKELASIRSAVAEEQAARKRCEDRLDRLEAAQTRAPK